MRAIVATRLGGPEVLELQEVPEPELRAGQVLIKVHRAGVNFADLSSTLGRYAQAPPPPFIPGLEVSGHDVATGKPVFAIVASGGYAELVGADFAWSAEGLDLDDAGGYPLAGLTAFYALRHVGRLQRGETVLVTAAAAVTVRDGVLTAGPARIPVSALGPVVVLDADHARAVRGPDSDPAGYHLIRGWVPCGVQAAVIDPDDSTPYWFVATRRPAALAAAIEAARTKGPNDSRAHD